MKTKISHSSASLFRVVGGVIFASFLNLAVTGLAGSFTGIYTGTYTSSNDHGALAVFVGTDDWGGLIHVDQVSNNVVQTSSGGGFSEGFYLSNGAFQTTVSSGTSISGMISGGTLTGTVTNPGPTDTLSATAQSSGAYQSSAGYYEGTTGESDGTINISVILAPDGNLYGGVDDTNMTSNGVNDDGFTGTMNANQFSCVSAAGTTVAGSLSTNPYAISGTWSSTSGSGSFTLNRTHSLTGPTTPWPDATDLGSGWKNSSWFGVFNVNNYPWIYHQQHGWMYSFGTDPASIWLWTSDLGFLWTGSGVYPWLWSDTQQTWLYYDVGSSNPRYFYNWNAQKWVAVNP
jgi:hypothetical protein